MNFLACEGEWSAGADGNPICSGSLISLTQQEMQALSGSALTWSEVSELQGEVITLFALVFGFLVLKKVLNQR
ncbi:conserved protein of unknown function [Pseudomonas marincola]|uniref:Uncharacterized protein n=1 Tax=Pseudomonas marincola TaxID=437900 RepID=A0A653E397_9PSED|nr:MULTISPECIES: hypothetical protein [Pseudomonas]OEO23704.1 hypothetical protein AX279_21560 [Pseudomonas sp. J237]CAE6888916.1 conserved protein of unknown function [Pseudomonas marincola]